MSSSKFHRNWEFREIISLFLCCIYISSNPAFTTLLRFIHVFDFFFFLLFPVNRIEKIINSFDNEGPKLKRTLPQI